MTKAESVTPTTEVVRDAAYYAELRTLLSRQGVPWYLGGRLAGTSRRDLMKAVDIVEHGR